MKVTLFRVSKDIEWSRYFQERVKNLGLLVEIWSDQGPLSQCTLRYYAKSLPLFSDSQEERIAELIDEEIELRNQIYDLLIRTGNIDPDKAEGLYGADAARAENIGNRLDKVRAQINDIRQARYAEILRLPKPEREAILLRDQLNRSSSFIGLFVRVAPVYSRLQAGGLYSVGRISGKLSRRSAFNGYVVIIHEPANLKIRFSLPNSHARRMASVKARIIELDDNTWEKTEPESRCKVSS